MQFLKDTVCSCLCNQKFSDTKDFLLGSGMSYQTLDENNSQVNEDGNDVNDSDVLTASTIYRGTIKWEQARRKLLHTKCQAYTISIFRILFVHWFQPIFYWFIFTAYKDNLDETQIILGYIVGIREIVYIILTIVCLKLNPTYLLVDVIGTLNASKVDFVTYVFAPEKFIYFCLDLKKIWCCGSDLFLFLLILFDLVGIAALIVAINNQITPPLLMIGYFVTTIGGVMYGSLILFEKLSKICRTRKKLTKGEMDGMVKGMYPIPTETSLHEAASGGHIGLCTLLIEKGADPNKAGVNGMTPLHLAACYWHTEIAKLLLEKGAGVNQADEGGMTPLDIADNDEIRELLRAKGGKESLFGAACNGHTEVAKLLLENGADPNQATSNGWTPLLRAALYGRTETVKLLLDAGAKINQADNDGWTPLYEAALNGQPEVAKLLLDAGADPNQADSFGGTPLHQASAHGHTEIAKLLLDAGAE